MYVCVTHTYIYIHTHKYIYRAAMQETWIWSLGWEDSLEKGMATHCNILAWRIPWTEEPGRLQSRCLQRVGADWATNTFTFIPSLWSLPPTLPSHPCRLTRSRGCRWRWWRTALMFGILWLFPFEPVKEFTGSFWTFLCSESRDYSLEDGGKLA